MYVHTLDSLPELLNGGVKEREVEGVEEEEESEGGVEFVHVGTLSPGQLLSREPLVDLQQSGGSSRL